ncbi:hypothetical protein [Naasia aerilata]|nr:hypothetical protein [Naasia aerilata]
MFSLNATGGAGYDTALLWAGGMRLLERGVPWLNLGGGARWGDGIDTYKRYFGGTSLPLGALKEVYRPDAFAALTERAGLTGPEESSYFPPYRRPGILGSAQPRPT